MIREQKGSPCLGCVRVADPGNCENKRCALWRVWFLARWEQIHGYYLRRLAAREKGADI